MSIENLIPLKKDWDAQPHITEKKGYHVVRTKEQKLLVDFIRRRFEGSLLVSGKRGVGKSSAIFSAMQKAIEVKKDEKIIPVLVIAPNFDIYEDHKQLNSEEKTKFKQLILQTLIRRLYSPASNEITNKSLKKKISELYEKAVAKEVTQEIRNTELEFESERVKRTSNFLFSPKNFGLLLTAVVGAGLFALFPINGLGAWQNVIALLAASVPTLSYSLHKSRQKIEGVEKKKKAIEYYRYDYDISNIQSDLEQLLKELLDNKLKIVFIIDELDKMTPANVMFVVRSLKSLITNGYAIYIFVTSTEFFSTLEQSSESRAPEYTLFTHRIFLQRPLFNEMEDYIDGILLKEGDSLKKIKSNKEYNDFKNYVCFLSEVDFFDLNQVLRDHIEDYDQAGNPLLNTAMNNEQITLSRLQKAMGQIYSSKAYTKPSDWKKNDSLLETMYWFLNYLNEITPGTNITYNLGPPFSITFPGQKEEVIEDEIEAGAINDLITHLIRLQYLGYVSPNQFSVLGTIIEVPSNPEEVLSKEEQEFRDQSEKLQDLAVNLFELLGEN